MPEFDGYRDRVIYAIDSGIKAGTVHPVYLPSATISMGQGYLNVVQKLMNNETIPEYVRQNPERVGYFEWIWENTKPWRTDIIERAIHQTSRKGKDGLARQEVYNVLGKSLGLPSDRYITYTDLYRTCSDENSKRFMEAFLRWLAQCHFVNQAKNYNVGINFPAYHLTEDGIIDSILRTPEDAPPSKEVGFQCEVTLPTIKMLSQVSPANLIAIRKDLGDRYLHLLEKWQSNPIDDNQARVEAALRFYCKEICEYYSGLAPVKIDVKIGKGRIDSIMTAVSNFIEDYRIPLLQHFNTLFRTMYMAHAESKEESRRLPLRQPLEITMATGARVGE